MELMSEEVQDTEATQEEGATIDINSKEVENELIRIAQARAENPTETAGTAYQMYVPHFKRAIPKLSTRGLRRVLNYLILYPLEQDSFNAANEFEKQVMQLAGQLAEAKFIMIMDSYRQHAEELYAAQNTPLTQEQSDEIADELGVERKTVTGETDA
jgi:superfamily II DNA or RNA helicase